MGTYEEQKSTGQHVANALCQPLAVLLAKETHFHLTSSDN